MIPVALEVVEDLSIGAVDLLLALLVTAAAPAADVARAAADLTAEEAAHLRLLLEPEEAPHPLVGREPAQVDQLVEADRDALVVGDRLHPLVDPPHPRLPPVEPLGQVAGLGQPARLRDAGGGGVAAVADDVDEAGFGEEAQERRRLRDRVAALLDQPRLLGGRGDRGEELEEELPAGVDGVGVVGGEEAVDGGVEGRALDVAVQAAEAGALQGDALVPAAAHALRELLRSRASGQEVGEPAGIDVEPHLVADVLVTGVTSEQPGHDVRSAASGAADEDDGRHAVGWCLRRRPRTCSFVHEKSGRLNRFEASPVTGRKAGTRLRSTASNRTD